MSAPGWYPDPGGQTGMFRYWDGQAWSAALSPTPAAAPPSSAKPPLGSAPKAGGRGADQRSLRADKGSPGPIGPDTRRATSDRKWWIIAAVGVVALVVVAGFAIRGITSAGGGGQQPGGQSTRSVCPSPDPQPPSTNATRDGRVYGGRLSYPMLPAPWGAPHEDSRVPFGRDAWSQDILVDSYVENGREQGWVASVLIAELNAGDGFFTPQAGSEIVVTCIVGAFYGNAQVTRNDLVNQATTVDGYEAWLVETHLTFDIKGLSTKGELAMVLIVATDQNRSSIYYASIPDTSPEWEAPARQAMADLRVGD